MKAFLFIVLLLQLYEAEAQTSAFSVADSLYAVGSYTKAINAYSEIGNATAALQIARSYNAIGNFEKAVLQYERIIFGEPNLKIAIFELGKLQLKLDEPENAVSLFFDLTLDETENPEYYYYLGSALKDVNSISESINSFKYAVALDSTHLRSLFQLAKYYTIKQERDSALHYIDKGLWLYANDVAMINLKALVLYNDFQFKNAIPLFERLLVLGEKKEYVYEKLAFCYYKNWEFEKAKQNYTLLLGRDNTNAQTYFSLASVYEAEKKIDSAKLYINKAMEVQKPIFAEGYARLAAIARDEQDLETAFKYYKMAYDNDATDARIYYNMTTVYDRLGTDPNAKLIYYQNFLKQYPNEHPYFYESARKRITELKEEIHYSKE